MHSPRLSCKYLWVCKFPWLMIWMNWANKARIIRREFSVKKSSNPAHTASTLKSNVKSSVKPKSGSSNRKYPSLKNGNVIYFVPLKCTNEFQCNVTISLMSISMIKMFWWVKQINESGKIFSQKIFSRKVYTYVLGKLSSLSVIHLKSWPGKCIQQISILGCIIISNVLEAPNLSTVKYEYQRFFYQAYNM